MKKVRIYYYKDTIGTLLILLLRNPKLPNEKIIKSRKYIELTQFIHENKLQNRTLDEIFNLLNQNNNPLLLKKAQEFITAHGLHTSMSSGDIIQINNRCFMCMPIGWKILQPKIKLDHDDKK